MKLNKFEAAFLADLMGLPRNNEAQVFARLSMLSARHDVDKNAVLRAINKNRNKKVRSLSEVKGELKKSRIWMD